VSPEDGEEPAGGWLDDVAANSATPDAGLIRSEELDALGAALVKLPEAERTVIMLRHFSQMSFKEIAEATGTPLGTALARAHRGLRRLRELLNAGDAGSACAPEDGIRGEESTK
jgi:RNA polymerase sigma-70 factor (ECF subfamily)